MMVAPGNRATFERQESWECIKQSAEGDKSQWSGTEVQPVYTNRQASPSCGNERNPTSG